MMKKSAKLLRIFLYITLVAVGFIAGATFSHYTRLSLSEEINLIDLSALIVTIFLAVYVPAVLDRQLQTQRDVKELLENRVSDYQVLIRRINMIVQNEHISQDNLLTIKNLLDIAGHRLDTLTSLIKNSGLDSSLNKDMINVKKVNEEHRTLLSEVLSKETNIAFTEQQRIQEELLYNKLDEVTSLLTFKINNSK